MPTIPLEDIIKRVGTEVGVSAWILVDQARIDAFAEVTGDHQFIHVDPVAAAKTEFGGTIAHGFLTLSLLSELYQDAALKPAKSHIGVNYGFERVRFLVPVRSGSRIRGRFVLVQLNEKRPGQWQFVYTVTVEIEGEDKPALVADWLTLSFLD